MFKWSPIPIVIKYQYDRKSVVKKFPKSYPFTPLSSISKPHVPYKVNKNYPCLQKLVNQLPKTRYQKTNIFSTLSPSFNITSNANVHFSTLFKLTIFTHLKLAANDELF